MTDLAPRFPCPVCLGAPMKKAVVGHDGAIEIDHCGRCGGIWLEHGEVQRLRTAKPAEVRKLLEPRRSELRMRCHDCHAPMGRTDDACPACGWSNTLDCPVCDRPMKAKSHAGLRIDLCGDCKGVWFDHHEVEAIWGAGFDQALRKRHLSRSSAAASAGDGVGDVLFDVLFFAPDLVYYGVRGVGHAAVASAEAVSHLPDAIGAAPEAAATVFEALGESAGSVFEVIVGIVGGIFDAL